jgi:methyl-accepting chemotaxis protein
MFSKLKLGQKMALGFATLIAIMCVVGGIASWTMKYCSTTARTLVEQDVNVMQITNDAGDATSGLKLNARSYGLSGDVSYIDKVAAYEGRLNAALKRGADLVALHPGLENLKESIVQTNKAIEDFDQAFKETHQAQDIISESASAKFASAADLTASLISIAADQKKAGSAHNTSIEDVQQSAARLEAVTEIGMIIGEIRAATLKGQLDHNPKPLADADAGIATAEKRLEELRPLMTDPTLAGKLQAAQLQCQAFRKATVRVLAGMTAMQDAYAHRAKAYAELDAAIDGISQNSRDHLAASATSVSQSLAFGMTVTVAGVLVALLVGAAVAYGVTRSITRPLSHIIGSLASGADQTLSAAEQVSSASQGLAQGASEQAASLEETSSSLEEMSTMTRKTADMARDASLLSAQTKTSADQGNRAMARMADAIDGIQKASSETAKIVKTIDEIAFQTNLLALNAAVEAARAGEAGKGFAVVAEEVRNLAMRSAEAARTTSSLIEGSVGSSKNGVTIAQEVGKTLVEIQQSVEKVNAFIAEIATASEKQSQGIGQVNQAMQQLDKVTQSNAAGAEESAAASEELSSQAEQVKAVVAEMQALVGGQAGASSADAGYRGGVTRQAGRFNSHPLHSRPTPSRSTSGRRVDPSKVIPLDEPNDREDFGEFDAAA